MVAYVSNFPNDICEKSVVSSVVLIRVYPCHCRSFETNATSYWPSQVTLNLLLLKLFQFLKEFRILLLLRFWFSRMTKVITTSRISSVIHDKKLLYLKKLLFVSEKPNHWVTKHQQWPPFWTLRNSADQTIRFLNMRPRNCCTVVATDHSAGTLCMETRDRSNFTNQNGELLLPKSVPVLIPLSDNLLFWQ